MSRLRRRQGTMTVLGEQSDLVVLDPKAHRGQWRELFRGKREQALGNRAAARPELKRRPLHIELGMGKGKFISELSSGHPDVDYIGMDMYDELIRKGSEKACGIWAAVREHSAAWPSGEMCDVPPNLMLALGNIERIEQFFAPGELDRIYLNFSDPWPKTRHAHRRLTHRGFLRKYMELLSEDGEIHFKTDSLSLFEFSLNEFSELDLKMRNISLDLHGAGSPPDNVMTEYETKFVGRGMNIYRCEVLLGKQAIERHRSEQAKAEAKRKEAQAELAREDEEE